MRHALPATIDALKETLDAVRARPELRERKHGTFYRKAAGFLHIHEAPAGLFADVKGAGGWERMQVDTPEQRQALLDRIEAILSD